jgi:hypothetical protein
MGLSHSQKRYVDKSRMMSTVVESKLATLRNANQLTLWLLSFVATPTSVRDEPQTSYLFHRGPS